MAFGLSFGKNKQKINSTTTTSGVENTTQAGTTAQNQTESQSSATSGLTQTAQTGTTSGQQTSSTQQQAVGRETQAGTTSLFSDSVLGALEAAGLGSLASVGAQKPIDTQGLAFDSAGYIADAVTQAQASAGMARQQGQNSLYDQIGGTAGGNTMAALLDQQLAIQEQGAVAGARNQAATAAADITQKNTASALGVQGQEQGLMTQLLGLLRGGTQTTSSTGETSQASTSGTQSASAEQQAQQSVQAQQSQTESINSLVSLISQLVSGTSTTSGTEATKGTVKKSGGGLGLSI